MNLSAAFSGWNRRDEHVAKIYAHYLAALKDANALDFDDLLLETVDLFEQSERVRAKYSEMPWMRPRTRTSSSSGSAFEPGSSRIASLTASYFPVEES